VPRCPWNLALHMGIKDAVVKAIYSRFVIPDPDEEDNSL
jgi:hypothetical protein